MYPHFLGSEIKQGDEKEALFHIIPVPYEESVSYGGGTRRGPKAILEASWQLEVWDGYSIPADEGIYTHEEITEDDPQGMAGRVSAAVKGVLKKRGIPVILGGEHTVSLGAFEAIMADKRDIGIVQIDAHADLRDEYEGNPFSHACVMRRAIDMELSIYQIGVRSLSPEEVMFREQQGIDYLDAVEAVPENFTVIELPDTFPENIYLTIDIDGFDPAVFSATGTPEPGGLGWYQGLSMIQSLVTGGRRIIGFDVVELAPRDGVNADPFGAARLVYNVMGIIQRAGNGGNR